KSPTFRRRPASWKLAPQSHHQGGACRPRFVVFLRVRSGAGIFGPMSEVTRILSAIEQGDPRAAERLLPLVYDELRKLAAEKMAQEKPGQTLQPTALVHEAYVRLVDANKVQQWNSRGHFLAAAAEAMRRILVERVRHKKSLKAGGAHQRIDLNDVAVDSDEQFLALHEAMEKLATKDKRKADLVQL